MLISSAVLINGALVRRQKEIHARRCCKGRFRKISVWLLLIVFAGSAGAEAKGRSNAKMLTNADFVYGTYVIDKPGVYKLAEDISFNPNSPATLTAAVESGTIPTDIAATSGLRVPVDAYSAGNPLFTQFSFGPSSGHFTPGGPLDARYDPSGFGLGFFAAICVIADDVVLDLNGHTIEQSAEHALLQRFFSVVELADQPFIPKQGPFGFGDELQSAHRVIIKNGVIGRSGHHGIHGNGNSDIFVHDVDFIDYEVAAIALNGVKGLYVSDVTAVNRKDVPVLGAFSVAQFIKMFINELTRVGSATTLTVGGQELTVDDIQAQLRTYINNVHNDIILDPNIVNGRAQIDRVTHLAEYDLFNNSLGLIDGNSYSFVVNNLGVAVNGFPRKPDDADKVAENIVFHNVHVFNQEAFINEVIALDTGDGAESLDPVGATFSVWNVKLESGEPITVSSLDPAEARYVGNPVANAQAFVAKSNESLEFAGSNLDLSRLNISAAVVDWVEGRPGSETLDDIGAKYLCNGDTMFHVNKGVIGFKMDAAKNVTLLNTSVNGLANFGAPGSRICGDYLDAKSHPKQTLLGYGGSHARGYTFSGSERVYVHHANARALQSAWGPAIGFDILTDTTDLRVTNASAENLSAGFLGSISTGSPTPPSAAIGFHASSDAEAISIRGCVTDLVGRAGEEFVLDESGDVQIVEHCRRGGRW